MKSVSDLPTDAELAAQCVECDPMELWNLLDRAVKMFYFADPTMRDESKLNPDNPYHKWYLDARKALTRVPGARDSIR